MATFYYTAKQTPHKGCKAQFIIKLDIYKINSKKCPVFLATREYNTGSCKGETTEVFRALVESGHLPKKYAGKYSYEIPHKAFKLGE